MSERLVRELDPGLRMLDTWCLGRSEGEKLLAESTVWPRFAPPTG